MTNDRIIGKKAVTDNKTMISFHQEKLSDQYVREEMKKYWEK